MSRLFRRPKTWAKSLIKRLAPSLLDEAIEAVIKRSTPGLLEKASEATLTRVRAEYTVMPRFGFHQPLDYLELTLPPKFEPPVIVAGEELPLPPAQERMGYAADDAEYLAWGQWDHDLVVEQVLLHQGGLAPKLSILDFGCSSGRVLRHFRREQVDLKWKLYGVDIQARPIEWMRRHFPAEYCVFAGTTIPHLPFADDSLDLIYGFSVFTHIKYNWDMWLLELRRILKPGGLLFQTVHAEAAWDTYYQHREAEWVQRSQSPYVLERPRMDVDYLYFGDASSSQIFWRKEIVREFWSRYFDVLSVLPPSEKSFQDRVICRKPLP